MASFKEIVTKAVIGKGKKNLKSNHTIIPENKPNTVLGCWIINHEFSGHKLVNTILVEGSYDVNVWYSYDGDTKTAVSTQKISYSEKMNVKLKEETKLTDDSEIIVRSLKQPSVSNVNINNNSINFDVEKEIGIEVVGDTIVRVSVDDEFDDYEEIADEVKEEDIEEAKKDIDKQIIEEYLK